MIRFFETLKEFINYDEEVFPCELVVSRPPPNPTVVVATPPDPQSLLYCVDVTNI